MGCWPTYGNDVIEIGKFGVVASWLVLAFYLAKHLNWVSPNNTKLRNLLGYCGGIAAGGFVIAALLIAAGSLVDSLYPLYMGYVPC